MDPHSLVKAVFVGSFDPFHDGHKNVVERALRVVDRVVVGVSINEEKTYTHSMEERVDAVRRIFAHDERVEVEPNGELTIDFAQRHGARVIVKGVRNAEDFAYEQEQALWNKRHGGIDTILFVADEEYAKLSSTLVRKREPSKEE